MKKLIALLLAAVMLLTCAAALAEDKYGPIYDDWSEKTDEELYELAKAEGGELTVRVRQEGAKVLVTVRDTGETIPADELPRIFDRFHKLDKSRSRDRDGVGLGLYIVKTIIGAHGEDIWVESHDGATAFTFTLPAVK